MEALGKRAEAAQEAVRLLDSQLEDHEANLELLSHLFYQKTLVDPDQKMIGCFIPIVEEILKSGQKISHKLRCRAVNNLVFALLKFGELDKATDFLGELGRWVHIDPYSTATLGLYHLIRGRVDRAEKLYREAISLSRDATTRERIRQRMCIELGRFFLEQGDRRLSKRYLNRAIKQKSGFSYAASEARKLLKNLPSV